MSQLGRSLSKCWENIQGSLFPWLEEELDPLTKKQKQLITILEIVRIEEFIPINSYWMGRPLEDRRAIARAFVAKTVYNMATTSLLLEHLKTNKNLRRVCGWEKKGDIPSEATFSRAFAFFAKDQLPQRVHEVLVKTLYKEEIIGHISHDSTAIESREKPQKLSQNSEADDCTPQKRKRGRPKKGEARDPTSKALTRIDKQPFMEVSKMLEDLPKICNVGCKKNAQGYIETWNGYKLHLGTAEGGVPVSAILTSASVHDSQIAIPLLAMTAQRVLNFYDLMDSAYDDERIKSYSRSCGHVPIIDINPRRNLELKKELEAESKVRKFLHWKTPEEIRYNERTTAERANARLKDDFGGRMVRVKGDVKVMCHLMFGVLALTADQLIRLIT